MKLPNWFKIAWWVLLLTVFTVLLATRYKDLIASRSIPSDLPIVLVWMALVILPLFQEVSFFGMTFKKDFEALKTNLKDEVASLRAEIRNSIDMRTQINPSFVLSAPPPDAQLPDIEKRIQTALKDALEKSGIREAAVPPEALTASSDVELLFRARYNIERELRRIWQHIADEEPQRRRFTPTMRIAQTLADSGYIDSGVAGAVKEVWLVASPAIHGESVTAAKVAFVREVAPKLVATLKTIR